MPTYRNTTDEWISNDGILFAPNADTPVESFHVAEGLVMVGNSPAVKNYDVLHDGVLPVADIEDLAKYKTLLIYNYTGDEIQYRAIVGHEDGEWIPLQDYGNVSINLRNKWDGLQVDGDGAGTITIIANY